MLIFINLLRKCTNLNNLLITILCCIVVHFYLLKRSYCDANDAQLPYNYIDLRSKYTYPFKSLFCSFKIILTFKK